jgi:hypothetical protein
MHPSETQLQQWAIAAGRHPIGSLERQQQLTHLLSAASRSRQLWRGLALAPDDYDEALQQTWLYICRRIETYDPDRAGVMTWINSHLKWRIKDIEIAKAQEWQQRIALDSVQQLERICSARWSAAGRRPSASPAHSMTHSTEHPATSSGLVTAIHHWLEQEEPRLQSIHIRQRPDLHCQMLIHQRLLLERPWQDLAQTYATPVSTLSNFFQVKCLPPLRQFITDWR